MANTVYENFVLANEVEDQLKSHLDLARFCTVDNSLVGTPGMIKKIHTYSATDGTEKLTMGKGNTKSIEASYTEKDYEILLAQNRFIYYDEEEMTDPFMVQTGMRHAADDMFNTMNADIFAEFNKATQEVSGATLGFDAFAKARAELNFEANDQYEIFAFINPTDEATLRTALLDSLQYVEAFARTGYIGSVAGINIYTKKDAVAGTICGGTKEAVTLFNKRGVEVEQDRDPDTRKNLIFTRKYYLAALTDDTKAFKISLGE